MKYFTRENITVKFPAHFALFIIFCPVFLEFAPGNELATLAFASLIKFVCIQYIARKGKQAFTLIRIWPLCGIAAANLLIGAPAFYLMNYNPTIVFTLTVICGVSAPVWTTFLNLLPPNSASPEDTEFVTVDSPLVCAVFIIVAPVYLQLVPGKELAALAFASLIKFLCIQYVARKGKKMSLLIRIWPFYIIAASIQVITLPAFYLRNSNPKIYIAVTVICLVSIAVSGSSINALPQNDASSEDTEFVSSYNDEKVEISE